MPAGILSARIVHEQLIPLQIKGKDAVDYWNTKHGPYGRRFIRGGF
jgi:hypothetical protein